MSPETFLKAYALITTLIIVVDFLMLHKAKKAEKAWVKFSRFNCQTLKKIADDKEFSEKYRELMDGETFHTGLQKVARLIRAKTGTSK